MIQVSGEKAHYLSDFELFERNGAAAWPSWLHRLRREAISRFAELRFPTTRDEEWRFTSVAPIVKTQFRLVFEHDVDGLSAAQLEGLTFGQSQWPRLVFVDGLYSRELSSLSSLPDGIEAANLAEAVLSAPDLVERHLTRYVRYDGDAFAALNAAFIRDGAFIYIPNGKIIDEPIHLLFIATARPLPAVWHPRNLIMVGRGAAAAFIESYISLSDGVYFTNAVTEIVLGENALVDYYKIQRESERAYHVATIQAYQERSSVFSSFSMAAGAALARENLNVLLDGEGGECALNGLYFVAGEQHVDNHTTIDHARPHGTSRELYKGILDGRSHAVFNGRIIVRKEAQRTDAKQTNKNLFLSDEAQVNTNPQLEILADDVKCTHGATVGQLDQEALFYLESRGISREAARALLTYGFASDVIGRVKLEPVRAELDRIVLAKFQRSSQAKERA